MAILAVGPLIYAALVVFAYPETARRSLDDINPEDRTKGGLGSEVGAEARRRSGRPAGRDSQAAASRRCDVGALEVVAAAVDPLVGHRARGWSPSPRSAPRASRTGSRVPWTNRHGTVSDGRCAVRRSSGLPGGWSG